MSGSKKGDKNKRGFYFREILSGRFNERLTFKQRCEGSGGDIFGSVGQSGPDRGRSNQEGPEGRAAQK